MHGLRPPHEEPRQPPASVGARERRAGANAVCDHGDLLRLAGKGPTHGVASSPREDGHAVHARQHLREHGVFPGAQSPRRLRRLEVHGVHRGHRVGGEAGDGVDQPAESRPDIGGMLEPQHGVRDRCAGRIHHRVEQSLRVGDGPAQDVADGRAAPRGVPGTHGRAVVVGVEGDHGGSPGRHGADEVAGVGAHATDHRRIGGSEHDVSGHIDIRKPRLSAASIILRGGTPRGRSNVPRSLGPAPAGEPRPASRRYPRGSPSPRVAMMRRWMSLVPPPMRVGTCDRYTPSKAPPATA